MPVCFILYYCVCLSPTTQSFPGCIISYFRVFFLQISFFSFLCIKFFWVFFCLSALMSAAVLWFSCSSFLSVLVSENLLANQWLLNVSNPRISPVFMIVKVLCYWEGMNYINSLSPLCAIWCVSGSRGPPSGSVCCCLWSGGGGGGAASRVSSLLFRSLLMVHFHVRFVHPLFLSLNLD